jgi:23S rRNA (cytosine1962-C5)-methyltransferase
MELMRERLYPLLLEVLQDAGEDVRTIYERCDAPAREKEGLPLRKGWWDGAPALATHVTVRENGLAFALDLENSQKTGFFLDQKYNRRAVRELSRGRRVLDCFCHVGPFGLNAAAGGAAFVRCVDVSQTAIDLAAANAELNGFTDKMAFTCDNVLDYLPRLRRDRTFAREEGGPFDLIVLDPPAFTKSRATVRNAARGYREINFEALRLLPRGGYLATCSCSQHMTRDLLAKAIAEAAHDANVQLKQVEERQQAPDHPILWGFPPSHYLDFFIFQVV